MQVTGTLARRWVFAVDVSPATRQRLRRKLDEAGIGNVSVAAAGFLSYDHVGAPADIVFSLGRTGDRVVSAPRLLSQAEPREDDC